MLFICRFKKLSLGNHSELDTFSYDFFYNGRLVPKILTFPPELPSMTVQVSFEEFYRKVQHDHSWSKHQLSKP
jgi:hypothetical protein